MRVHRFALTCGIMATCLLSSGSADGTSVVALLDRYAAGDFERVVEHLEGDIEYRSVLEQLRRDGPGWIERGAGERARRELTAATFALEAARAGSWYEWKIVKRQPRMCTEDGKECYQPQSVLSWQAPPLLLEWGCALLRRHATPQPVERWWQLAALSVAQRAEDPHFLIGHLKMGANLDEIVNTQDEIQHLLHVRMRFPDEKRFLLAEGIAREGNLPDESIAAYKALEDHPDLGGEATMRLGAMHARRRTMVSTTSMGRRIPQDASAALSAFERAEALTRDPYVVFLARYFKGQLLEQQKREKDAEAAYRGAVASVPDAPSATIALASLVFRDDRRLEAQRLIAGMLAADPQPVDPWRTYAHADDRFWPRLIARLRAEIRP